MNLKIVFYYLGWVLNIEAVLMLLPCAVSLVYGDGMLPYFLVTMIICTVIGFMTAHKKPADTVFYAREGFLTGGADLGDAQLLWCAAFLVQSSDPVTGGRHV